MSFEVTLTDETVERVDGADSYALEGPLTTFFGNDRPRPLDSWSVKVASYRTDRIARIRRLSVPSGPELGTERLSRID
jgi:hypothetical protein